MDIIGISLIETGGQIFLRGQPHSARPPVDVATLRALLVQGGYGECAFDEDALTNAAQYCNTLQAPFVAQVAERRNAHIAVHIAADDMSAEVSVTPAHGGKAATLGDLIQALTESGVQFGIDDGALLLACEQHGASRIPIARGVLPEEGRNSVFEELVAQAADRSPKLDENGLIDYREHGTIKVVNAGTPLMRRIPATTGVEGRTVRGRALPAHPGRDEPFSTPLAGAQVASDDPNLLLAAVTGQPVRVKGGVTVEPILHVGEVNMATGNVHFNGTVQVKGDVVQGMVVQASGDIVVGGMVDGGVLEAGGDIRIAGGVIAHAKITAHGSVNARFAQAAQIHADAVLALADMALDCALSSHNQIIIGADAPGRGRLVGGTATAMMLVRVPLLGSAKGALTKMVLGANAGLTAQYAALQERIQKEKETEENLDKLVKQVAAAGDPKGMLPRIKASWQHAIQVWGQSLAERDALCQQIALALNARVEVGSGVSGSVDISFGSHTARLRQEFGAGTFSLDAEGNILFTDNEGLAVPAV